MAIRPVYAADRFGRGALRYSEGGVDEPSPGCPLRERPRRGRRRRRERPPSPPLVPFSPCAGFAAEAVGAGALSAAGDGNRPGLAFGDPASVDRSRRARPRRRLGGRRPCSTGEPGAGGCTSGADFVPAPASGCWPRRRNSLPARARRRGRSGLGPSGLDSVTRSAGFGDP
jgi:hypothetical protein